MFHKSLNDRALLHSYNVFHETFPNLPIIFQDISVQLKKKNNFNI